jgi:hypothetical protein
MIVFQAIPYPFDPKPYKEQVRQGINNLGRVYGGIIILCDRMVSMVSYLGVECDRPSHQLIVEVTGAQNPSSGRAGGYLIAGKPNTIFAATDGWRRPDVEACSSC